MQGRVLLHTLFVLLISAVCVVASGSTATELTEERVQSKSYFYAAVLQPDGDDGQGLFTKENLKKIRIINLGPVVNWKGYDYAPTVSADGRTLYFVSNRPGSKLNKNGDPSHDFWATKKLDNLDTNFFPPFNIDTTTSLGEGGVNTKNNEGVASIAADNQTLFFTGCNRPDGYGSCDIYVTEINGDVWGKPRNLGRNVNSEYFDSQPSISADKSRLYFVSNRVSANHPDPGGAEYDIYYSDWDDETSQWKPAKNLKALNTKGSENSPFIGADGVTLFFSSTGHTPNLGKLDFYYSRKTGTDASGEDTWSKPIALPAPINTPDDEYFITLPASGDIMYWSSSRKDRPGAQGDLDIMMAFIPKLFRAVQVVTNVVDECSGANIPATVTVKNATTGKVLRDSLTFTKIAMESIFGDKDFGKDTSVKFVDLEITASNAQYGEKKVIQRITRPDVVTSEEEAQKQDNYKVVIKMGQRPTIEAQVEISEHAKKQNNAEWMGWRGLVLKQVISRELSPILNYVFFDIGMSDIPKRYVKLTSAQTGNFNDERIPGGTLEKYYHVMNIYGYRLRKFPNAKIKVVGCNDNTTPSEKAPNLSKQRAENVYNYLKDVWGISPDRMTLAFQNLPDRPSNLKDTQGIVENRRVELQCDDWDIVHPILDVDPKIFPQPEEMTFVMKNGIDDELVTKRRVEIKRNEKMWNTLTEIGTTQGTTKWNWESPDAELLDTTNLNAFKAQLIVTSKTGLECASNPISIPVRFVTSRVDAVATDGSGEEAKTLEKYNLVLFKFDSPEAGPLNDRILREYIFPRVKSSSDIVVEGHTDVVGQYDRNKTLSRQRAQTCETGINKSSGGKYKSMKSDGTGEDNPLYDNALPEGRFYNRTVQIRVQTPLKDADLEK